ncbi:hypothetical protein DEA06_03100 [Microbacterium sp. Gd 4-13]|uniref:hypothetical protein n=1 Tax=Microbacterium sp. Gd 4-13 TaxID=2173179 RepID=UPI000D564195|nr:hypothetical protein [Microbacterium sp. Gd 4-13]PVW06514.1 hypothetical protein DEA06_03100 [Microbacterium sp. Gd 4-13]
MTNTPNFSTRPAYDPRGAERLNVEKDALGESIARGMVGFALRGISDIREVRADPKIADTDDVFVGLRADFPDVKFVALT